MGRFCAGAETFTLVESTSGFATVRGNHFPQQREMGANRSVAKQRQIFREQIPRSELGETILFRYNSKTQFRHDAPVAQLDRVLGYEPRGWEFDSLRAHHLTRHGYCESPDPRTARDFA